MCVPARIWAGLWAVLAIPANITLTVPAEATLKSASRVKLFTAPAAFDVIESNVLLPETCINPAAPGATADWDPVVKLAV
jgi:hypothetical protein